MADRKSFLLRLDQETFDAVQRWANDELRSEFLLRRALRDAGRLGGRDGAAGKGRSRGAAAGGR